MKKTLLCIAAFLLLFSLVSCESAWEQEDGMLIVNIEGTDISYKRYENYMAVSVKIGTVIAETEESEYFAVSGLDMKKYLCTHPDRGSVVYAEQSIELPQLKGFNPTEVYVCYIANNNTVAQPLENAAVLEQLVTQMSDNQVTAMPTVVHQSYILDFVSKDYPSLYYSLRFVVDRQGNGYLIDRQTNRCVSLSAEVTQALIV